jgi:Na+/H+ antiporter NhaD/arsenite permease-like protein
MGSLTLAVFVVLVLAGCGIWVWGTPVFGIPVLIIALAFGAFLMFAARAKRAGDIHTELDDAKPRKTEFTERDRQTIA